MYEVFKMYSSVFGDSVVVVADATQLRLSHVKGSFTAVKLYAGC